MTTGVQVDPVRQKAEAFTDDVNIFWSCCKDLSLILSFGSWQEKQQWELPWAESVQSLRILGLQVEGSYISSNMLQELGSDSTEFSY